MDRLMLIASHAAKFWGKLDEWLAVTGGWSGALLGVVRL